MRRAARSFAAVLVVAGLAACRPAGADPGAPDPAAALPRAQDLPGGAWSLVGTTDRRPAASDSPDPLGDADGTSSACRSALEALDAAANHPDPGSATPFERAVYRASPTAGGTPGPDDRDLTLTVESSAAASAHAAGIGRTTSACRTRMTTRAGAQELTVRLARVPYSAPGSVGYRITYDAAGLRHYFDMVVVTSGTFGVTASTTGGDAAQNRSVLDAVTAQALSRLRHGGTGPTPSAG